MNNAVVAENRLPIRVRKILGTDSEHAEFHSVYCPQQKQSVAVEQCLFCAYCAGTRYDPTSRQFFVSCIAGPDDEPAVCAYPRKTLEEAADTTPLSEIMTTRTQCVTADTSVEELVRLLLDGNMSGVPVVDHNGKAIGIVSKTDIVRESSDYSGTEVHERLSHKMKRELEIEYGPGFHSEKMAATKVGEIMTPMAFQIPETASIAQAAALMAFESIHRLPVVSKDGVVIGILSAMDILRFVAEKAGYLREPHR